MLVDRPFEETTWLADGLKVRHLFIIIWDQLRDYRGWEMVRIRGGLMLREYDRYGWSNIEK